MLPYVKNNNTITIFLNGVPRSVNSTHLNWKKIVETLPTATATEMQELLDVDDIIANGVYMVYMIDKHMYCAYSKSNLGIYFVNKIDKIQDFDNATDLAPPPGVLNAKHVGTYLTVKEILVDYAERFI